MIQALSLVLCGILITWLADLGEALRCYECLHSDGLPNPDCLHINTSTEAVPLVQCPDQTIYCMTENKTMKNQVKKLNRRCTEFCREECSELPIIGRCIHCCSTDGCNTAADTQTLLWAPALILYFFVKIAAYFTPAVSDG